MKMLSKFEKGERKENCNFFHEPPLLFLVIRIRILTLTLNEVTEQCIKHS